MDSTFQEKLDNLKAALEAAPPAEAVKVPVLKVDDLYQTRKYLFGNLGRQIQETVRKEVLAQHIRQLPNGEEERYRAPCVFLSIRTTPDRLEEAAYHIARNANMLAMAGWAVSVLAPLSSIELAPENSVEQQIWDWREQVQPGSNTSPRPELGPKHTCVFCFIHVKPEYYKMALTSRYATDEGQVGPVLE